MHHAFALAASIAAAGLLPPCLPAQGHWYVAPTGSDADPGTQAQPFQTINHAATVASAGDVIHLAAAVFGDEQGIVALGTETLTLVGEGMGATVLRAHSSLDQLLPAGLLATPTVEAHRCALTLQGSARVDLRDLTLDNGFSVAATGRAYSLWVGGGADTVCDHVEFTNARANPINGIQAPLAVNVRRDGVGDPTEVTLRNCLVHEYGKGGVVANFDAHLEMDECRVEGCGHAVLGLAAQNGIQVSRGARCTLRRTTVADSWYEPATVVATGLLLFDAGSPVIVEDCSFGNCQVGIYAFASAPAALTGSIARCRVHAADYGIYLADVSGLTMRECAFAVALSGDNNDAWDDGSGNTWSGNSYSSLAASGSHLLPGTAVATDATARAGCPGFGSSTVLALPAGLAPVGLVGGDLDGDGRPDLAALCQGSSTPALATALTGGGTLTVAGSLAFASSSASPVAIASGQLDGMPGTDLAVVTVSVPPATTENRVFVFANDGAGGFSLLHAHTLASATAPSSLAVGDVDGDTIADLVVGDAGATALIPGSATVLRNNGAGTSFTESSLPGAFTFACRGVAIGDFDRDGLRDVAVTEGNASIGRLHLFHGDGLGGFVAAPGGPLATSANAQGVLAADLDGDGALDLLVSCTRDAFGLAAGAVDVLENDAPGVFVRSEYRVDRGPATMAAGDLDNDADPDSLRRDVVVTNLAGGSVTVLGTFTPGAGFGSGGVCVTGAAVTAAVLGDFTGDGIPDLAYGDAVGGSLVVVGGELLARADSYGTGCAGTSGRVPNLSMLGAPPLPVQPNATTGLGLSNGRPLSVAVFAAALGAAPIAPCSLLISGIGATWVVLTNVHGEATIPLPIPPLPYLIGLPLYCQAGVFDVEGGFFPGVSLTQGLRLRLGH